MTKMSSFIKIKKMINVIVTFNSYRFIISQITKYLTNKHLLILM